MATFRRPSPAHPTPRAFRPRYRRVCISTRCLASPLPIVLSVVAMLLLCLASKKNERKEESERRDTKIQQWKQNNKNDIVRYTYKKTRRVRQLGLGCESN